VTGSSCGPSPIRRRLAYRGSNGTMVIFVRRAAGDVTEETEPSACNYAGERLAIRAKLDFIIGYVAGVWDPQNLA